MELLVEHHEELERLITSDGIAPGGPVQRGRMTPSPPAEIVYLSDQWASAAEASRQSLFVAAAEALIAINRTPTAVGVLTTIGMIIVSIVMLKAGFPRRFDALRITTGGARHRERGAPFTRGGW